MSTLLFGGSARHGRTNWIAWPRGVAWCVGVFAVAWSLTGTLRAEDGELTIERFLGAGEFAPALQAAERLPTAAARNTWLGRIAEHQARSGARRAALDSLAAIDDDLARRRAVDSLAGSRRGSGGGAAIADFDSLIELITSTIAPDTWDEVGGAGAIEPFPNGVYVDSRGVLKQLQPADDLNWLDDARRAAAARSGNAELRRSSPVRKVSLVRLERELQLRRALGQDPNEAMAHLAGLYEVTNLFVYPQSGDVVITGPAGEWRTDANGREVNCETGRPVLQLDDLIVLVRNAWEADGQFGCSIEPKQERLAQTKAFVESWQNKEVKPDQREAWVADLRSALGKQDVKVWGIDSRTRTARVIIEADYHMKRIGMGLEPGTMGVSSYLEMARQKFGRTQPPMNVLRWWFTLNYAGVEATRDHLAFHLSGPGVKVLSENELLTATGKRVHTGKTEELNRAFASSFTRHFTKIADRYPLYYELKNVFDLALIAAILREEDVPGQVQWHLTHFRDAQACPVRLGPQPLEIESIVNSVEISRRQFLAGVSGGVSVDTRALVQPSAVKVDDYGAMDARRSAAAPDPPQLERHQWWWD